MNKISLTTTIVFPLNISQFKFNIRKLDTKSSINQHDSQIDYNILSNTKVT
jgi:hypothetical protein